VRDTAIGVLLRVFEQGAFLDLALDAALRRKTLSDRGRRLLTQLVYGTVRYKLLCDYVLGPILRQSLEDLPRPIHAILRMGVFQALFCRQATFPAMVHTSVDLAKRHGHPGTARLVNAVLKRAPQSLQEVRFPNPEQTPEDYLSIRHSMPHWLVSQWIAEHGRAQAETLCDVYNTPCQPTLRTNTLKTTPAELIAHLTNAGFSPEKRTPIPEEVTLGERFVPARSKLFAQGHFFMQDPASMLTAHLLEPVPGNQVLDLCAAPGGKTTHIAQLAGGQCRVVAQDCLLKRLSLLRVNVARLGVSGIAIVCGDGAYPPFRGGFDRVLVDAPCTGLGTLRRHPDLKWRIQPEHATELGQLQRRLLSSAIRLCNNGGLIVYSVCTWTRDETELVVRTMLDQGDVEPEDGPRWLDQWKTERGQYKTLPQIDGLDGFFLTRFRKRC
jgi:16S rRNA (cytosine967-C5)-methyltransferase